MKVEMEVKVEVEVEMKVEVRGKCGLLGHWYL